MDVQSESRLKLVACHGIQLELREQHGNLEQQNTTADVVEVQ